MLIHRSERQQDKDGQKEYVYITKLPVNKARGFLFQSVSRRNCEPSNFTLEFPRERSVFHEEALVEQADDANEVPI